MDILFDKFVLLVKEYVKLKEELVFIIVIFVIKNILNLCIKFILNIFYISIVIMII